MNGALALWGPPGGGGLAFTLLRRVSACTPARIEARINELETTRDLSRIWVVIDMVQ